MNLIPYQDIILIKNSRSLWSVLIKFFLKSKYIHSEYVIDQWLTFGTDLSRPASIHTFGFNMNDIDIYRIKEKLSDEQINIITEELQKATTIKYDWIEACCLGLGIKYRGNENRYVCISIILQALEKANVIPLELHKSYKDFTVFTESNYFEKA